MVTIREKNAKDLKSSWKKFIKEQEGKHGRDRENKRDTKRRTGALE